MQVYLDGATCGEVITAADCGDNARINAQANNTSVADLVVNGTDVRIQCCEQVRGIKFTHSNVVHCAKLHKTAFHSALIVSCQMSYG